MSYHCAIFSSQNDKNKFDIVCRRCKTGYCFKNGKPVFRFSFSLPTTITPVMSIVGTCTVVFAEGCFPLSIKFPPVTASLLLKPDLDTSSLSNFRPIPKSSITFPRSLIFFLRASKKNIPSSPNSRPHQSALILRRAKGCSTKTSADSQLSPLHFHLFNLQKRAWWLNGGVLCLRYERSLVRITL